AYPALPHVSCVGSGVVVCCFFFSSRRRHTRSKRDWSSDVCSSDLRFANAKEVQKVSAPFWPTIIAKLDQIAVDTEALTKLEIGPSSFISPDVRDSTLEGVVDAEIGRASCRERAQITTATGSAHGER